MLWEDIQGNWWKKVQNDPLRKTEETLHNQYLIIVSKKEDTNISNHIILIKMEEPNKFY